MSNFDEDGTWYCDAAWLAYHTTIANPAWCGHCGARWENGERHAPFLTEKVECTACKAGAHERLERAIVRRNAVQARQLGKPCKP